MTPTIAIQKYFGFSTKNITIDSATNKIQIKIEIVIATSNKVFEKFGNLLLYGHVTFHL